MATTHVEISETESPSGQRRIVNDLSIQVATANGSGSQSSNMVLLRAILQMGIPVSGKNLFPSNIEGLPTWFTIRASKYGYIGRRKEIDFLVCMNPETAQEDVMGVDPGTAVVYDQRLNLEQYRKDLIFYSVPFDKLTAGVCPEAKLRKLVKNMVYVGVVAYLLGVDMAEVEKALRKQFKNKAKAANLNLNAAKAGFEFAQTNLEKKDRFYLERMNLTAGKILIDGNSASALGCMMAGVTVVTWYPITPSSSLCETLIGYMKRFRIDPETGKATFAIVQAEDELASIGMALGAGWAGARSMTATAGPGLSLMSEFIGLGYYVEVPAVIFDVQRVGPSTGLPTRTAQGDVLTTAFLSHGDTKHPLFFPCSVAECYTMAIEAFDLAEHIQSPVFVMTDLDLGMNYWMSDPFPYPEKPIRRGKVLSKEDLDRLGSFERYRDVDGDGIGYRTLPGTDHPAASYFARGSGHNEKAAYSEKPADYANNMDRLARKFETARGMLLKPEFQGSGKADIGIIAYGTSHWAVTETIDQLKQESGVDADYCRVLAFPFAAELTDFIRRHKRIYVVDQNRDGQIYSLMRLDLEAELIPRLRSIRHYNGIPIDARSVTDAILAQEAQQ